MVKKQNCKITLVVGINITAYRKIKGWTQEELAEKLDMGADSLSRIERGHVAPRFPRLEDFAEVLECSVADLFKTSEELANIKFVDYAQNPMPDIAAEINMLAERISSLSKKIKNNS